MSLFAFIVIFALVILALALYVTLGEAKKDCDHWMKRADRLFNENEKLEDQLREESQNARAVWDLNTDLRIRNEYLSAHMTQKRDEHGRFTKAAQDAPAQ